MNLRFAGSGIGFSRPSAASFAPWLCAALCAAALLLPGRRAWAAENETFRDPDELKTAAEEILASPEFRHLVRGSGSEASSEEERKSEEEDEKDAKPESKRSWFATDAFNVIGSAAGAIFHGLAWGLLAIVCVLILYLAVRAVSDRLGGEQIATTGRAPELEGEAEPETAPGELPADVYVDRARELASGGQFREAVAQLLLGGMSQIERAGRIRFRRGLTYRDYLRAARGEPAVHAAMKTMVELYEPVGFGRRQATRDLFERSLERYQAGFHASQTATAS